MLKAKGMDMIDLHILAQINLSVTIGSITISLTCSASPLPFTGRHYKPAKKEVMDTGRSSDSALAFSAVCLYILYLVVVLLLLALECTWTRYY